MNGRLALVRATHLNDYIAVLREIGAPVDRELGRSLLPQGIEETPDLYVSVPVALEWVAKTGHDLHPMELGLLGAQKASLAALRPAQQAAIMSAQTGLQRLRALAALSQYEDSALEMSLRNEGEDVRVICTMKGFERHVFLCFSEWLNLQAVVSVVRSVTGPSWCPAELSFVSPYRPVEAVRAAFPDARILVGQPHSSVLVPQADLAHLTLDATAVAGTPPIPMPPGGPHDDATEPWEFVHLLRMLIQPYVEYGHPDVAVAAELAGMSTRTLQRHLKLCGSSYSQILQEARFQLACTRLEDPTIRVIEIALMTGYENPQHFSRAFLRFTGVTPSEYRLRNAGIAFKASAN